MATIIRIPPQGSPEWARSLDPDGVLNQWHQACRELFPDGGDGSDGSDFTRNGFEKMTFLEAVEADALRRRVDAAARDPEKVRRLGDYQDLVVEGSPDYLPTALEKILNDEVTRRVQAYFGSEFFVHWYQFCRAYPHPAPDQSFLWHRDGGPAAFVNIMVYLNDTDEHGGGTEVVDRLTTARLAKAGYDGPKVEDRVSDLSGYAAKAGVAYEPWSAHMKPGEGLIFQPTRVLHRGILPTRGPRYVLFLNLLPSYLPWREGLGRWTMPCMELVAGNWTVDFISMLAGEGGPTVVP